MADSPLWLENAGNIYNAGEYRRWLHRVHKGRAAIFGEGHLLVSQRAAGANLSVDVAAGACLVKGTESTSGATKQGLYLFNEEAVTNLAIAAGGASARTDLVIVRVRDSEYSGAVNSAVLEVVQGVGGGGVPALPANSFELARIAVGIGAASIVNANITDRRSESSGGHYVAPWGVAWGERSRSVLTANVDLTTNTTVLTGDTITVLAGRKLVVSVSTALLVNTDTERGRVWLEESVDGGAFAEIAEVQDHRAGVATARVDGAVVTRRTIAADGTRRYRIRGEQVSGTGTVRVEAGAANPTELIVEDAGPGALA